MLKHLRVGVAFVVFLLLSFFFIDFAGLLPWQIHGIAHVQLVPALLASAWAILLVWLAITLLSGRVYCSAICPLGIFQDIVNRISRMRAKRKKKFTFSNAKHILRWSVLTVVTLASLSGFTLLLALVEPYSVFGRVVTHVFKPLYMGVNNVLASLLASFGNYTFYKVDAGITSLPSFLIGLVTLLVLAGLAWRFGRTWCNTICPVGTFLGFVSKYAWFKVQFDPEKCNRCGACTSKCKASCLDGKSQKIDYTRCVACFNCLGSCKKDALHFAPSYRKTNVQPAIVHPTSQSVSSGDTRPEDASRRQFLSVTAATTAFSLTPKLLAQETLNKVIGAAHGVKSYKRLHPITPPGSVSQEHFSKNCTSCHLCVSKCPSHILKPAFMEYGLGGIMQPTMSFEKGFCNFDCTMCGNVCPNKAIQSLSVEEKRLTQVGYVVLIEENCIVYREGTNCGACSEHCPTQAITMVPHDNGLTVPKINTDICVGCGGCEYVCPAEPFRAVYIEGNPVQKKALPFTEQVTEEIEIDDFGF